MARAIYAGMGNEEVTSLTPRADLAFGQAGGEELSAGDNPMGPPGQAGDDSLGCA